MMKKSRKELIEDLEVLRKSRDNSISETARRAQSAIIWLGAELDHISEIVMTAKSREYD